MMAQHARGALVVGRASSGGFAMIEVLIAMFLIALWMLASAGTQLASIKFQTSSANRTLAIALAGELSERIEANGVAAKSGSYALAARSTATDSGIDCTTTHCTPTQMAAFDLAQWSARVTSTLPLLASMSVVAGTNASGLVTYTIRIDWNEPRGRQTYASSGTTEVLSYVLTRTVRHADV